MRDWHERRHHTPITYRPSTIRDALRPHPHRGEWGLVVLRPVRSVGPDETVQQGTRVDAHLLVDDGDESGLEDGVSEIGVHGETCEARPNAHVGHRVLVGVIPSVGDIRRLDRADATLVGHLVQGPGFASAGSTDPVDGPVLDSVEGGVLGAVDGGAHFLFPLVGWVVPLV